MSLKIVHFIVFIITSIMFLIFSVICWKQFQAGQGVGHMMGMCIAFAIGGVGLFIYSFWYLKKARNTIV